MSKIGILVNTFMRDLLLKECIDKMIKYMPNGVEIFISDQGNPMDIHTLDKVNKYSEYPCHYYQLPFNCGISVARNYLVEQAYDAGCDFVILASDSFLFTEKTDILSAFPALVKYDIVGFKLEGAKIYWVGELDMIPDKCFTLDFADRREDNPKFEKYGDVRVLPCSIIHNFFMAHIEPLKNIGWDNRLVMAEHESAFYAFKKAGYKVCWTPDISCEYQRTREGIHAKYRQENWQKGIKILLEKHNLTHWIEYKNLPFGKAER